MPGWATTSDKGQILARYHADEVRDSRAQYRAAVSELDRAKAAAAQAQRNRDRAQRLLELKAGSVQQVEQAQQDLVSAQAAVKKAQIEVDRGRDLLEDDLRVPADPPANRKDETEDEVPIIAPGRRLHHREERHARQDRRAFPVTFVIGDLSKVWMLASVRQEDLGRLRVGPVRVRHACPAWIRRTLPGQDHQPRTAVRSQHTGDAGSYRTEQIANAACGRKCWPTRKFPSAAASRRCSLPSDAVQQVNGQDVVFVRTAPDRFAVRPVRVGETCGRQDADS